MFDTNVLPRAHLFGAKQLADSRHQPLNDPVWSNSYNHLRDDDPVLGLYLGGRAWALPWWIMNQPHVANLFCDDRPVLVTLCPMCSSAAAFWADVEGKRLVFRVRGRYNGTSLLADTATDSFWSPFTGVALAGVLRGAVLERLPLSQCLWSEWLAMHPTTKALYGAEILREGRSDRHSPGSPGIGLGMQATLVRPIDQRFPHNMLVLGVENGANARAYPLQTLTRIGPAVDDSIGDVEIIVRSRPGTLQALAFRRRVGQRVLDFASSITGQVYDQQTGSVWNEMGEAVSGPLVGTQLQYVKSGVGEWYEFAARHPETEIFKTK